MGPSWQKITTLPLEMLIPCYYLVIIWKLLSRKKTKSLLMILKYPLSWLHLLLVPKDWTNIDALIKVHWTLTSFQVVWQKQLKGKTSLMSFEPFVLCLSHKWFTSSPIKTSEPRLVSAITVESSRWAVISYQMPVAQNRSPLLLLLHLCVSTTLRVRNSQNIGLGVQVQIRLKFYDKRPVNRYGASADLGREGVGTWGGRGRGKDLKTW